MNPVEELDAKLREAYSRLDTVMEKLNTLSQADDSDAQVGKQRQKANDEYHKIWDEIFSLEEKQKQLTEKFQSDAAYDGLSPSLTKEEELLYQRAHAMKNKADILAAAYQIKEASLAGSFQPELPREVLASVLDRFTAEIYQLQLPELNQDWWQYQIQIREAGITLSLVHTEIRYDYGAAWKKNVPVIVPDQVYPLYTAKARLLTPEEFGRLYGEADSTVSDWIRSGALCSACRYGNDWKIPELSAVLRNSELSIAEYSWQEELPAVPDDLDFLESYRNILIYPSDLADRPWEIELSGGSVGSRILSLNSDTAEHLRLWLRSQPSVQCVNNVLRDFIDKALPGLNSIAGKEV